MYIIMGIDPGLAHTGWGVIQVNGNRLSHIASGTIKTTKNHDDAARLHEIYVHLQAVIMEHKPVSVGVEEVFVNTNAKSSLRLGQARGIALLVPTQAGISVAEYSALKVKQSVVGYGRADKTQIAHMVQVLLPAAKPKTEHAADALAIAICHAHHLASVQSRTGTL